MRWLTFLVVLAPLVATADNSWTNQAGKVIHATLDSFDGTTVRLVRTNGTTLSLPLTALCAADQLRARRLLGQTIVPEFVQAAYRDAQSVLERFESLPAHQQSSTARIKASRMATAAFDKRLQGRAAELQEKGVQAEVQRLRASLATSAP